jgi:glutamate 5-kinase
VGRHHIRHLLIHDDFANLKQSENVSATLNNLLALGIVPIVNENDTVATDEIKLGDNDTLAALVANLVGANQYLR